VNRQRSSFGFLVAGVIALLVISLAGFYWLFSKNPIKFTAPTSQPSAAIFVSKLAPAMVSLLVNPDSLQALEQQGEVSQFKTRLLAKSKINYQKDVQPWLGQEITLAVTTLDIDRDPKTGIQPGYLLALATKNPEKSREFLELLFSQRTLAGANLAVEKYQGVKLLYDTQESVNDLAGAVVGNKFVLFANHPKVLRDAINNVQAPDLNLSSSPKYQKVIQQQPQGAVAVAFLNLPYIAQWQGLELQELTYDSQLVSLILNPQGLLAETTLLATSKIVPQSEPLSQPVGALKYLPVSVGLTISGENLHNLGDSNLAKFWRQTTATIYGAEADVISRVFQPLTNRQKRWGLNLTEDIFSWVSGEYALALLPSEKTTIPNWVFVVEKSPQLLTGIARINEIAAANGLNISSLTLGQQAISAWTDLQADTQDKTSFTIKTKVKGAHTTLDNYEIFTSSLETMNQILTAKDNFLIDNPNFQDSIAVIPQPNQGYVYIDWQKSQALLERQLPIIKWIEILGKPLFQNLQSLTVSSYDGDTELLKGGVFFQLHH
jgi:hypothetical protein